jgi:acyl-CoA synthetase (AMP-forming)/AMP-acid ligase II
LTGAVLNTLNIRLDAEGIAFQITHGAAKVLLTDREFSPLAKHALSLLERQPLVIDIDDPLGHGGALLGAMEYESFLLEGKPPTSRGCLRALDLAAVVGRPDAKWGEVPCAFVQLQPNATATETEIRQFCREQMAGYKVTKIMVFGPIPRTSTGKIQKRILRELAKSMSETTS